MMLDYDRYQADNAAIREARRAKDAWKRIQRRPTEIVVYRDAQAQPAQTVRIELSTTTGSTAEIMDASGASSRLAATVFGVKGHPDEDVADTDIRRDDRFVVGVQWFRVMDVIQQIGEVQALCEVQA